MTNLTDLLNDYKSECQTLRDENRYLQLEIEKLLGMIDELDKYTEEMACPSQNLMLE